MEKKHTPGPWFFDAKGQIWRRDPSDLYENGGSVAGDKPIAVVNKGWYRENEQGYPVEDNARLIAAAPELLDALEALVRAHNEGLHQWAALDAATAAIAKATGGAQ